MKQDCRHKSAAGHQPLRRLGRALAHDTSGHAMTMLALAMVPLIGCVGLGVDVSQWILWKRELRGAADMSALAGARAIGEERDIGRSVRRALASNDAGNDAGAFVVQAIETPPTAGVAIGDEDAVRVVLSTNGALPFSSMFLRNSPTVSAEATAIAFGTTPNCVITLDPANTTSLTISGSAQVQMNCGMAANSVGSRSILADGQSVDVPSLAAAGGIAAGSGVAGTTELHENVAPVADPLAGLTLPNLATMCAGATTISVRSLRSQTIGPGCYASLKSLGALYLQPGIYYIDKGDVEVGSQSLIQGSNVTLVFTNSSTPFDGTRVGTFKAAGNSYINLSASVRGAFAGILMYQDRRTVRSSQTDLVITGTSNAGMGIVSGLQGTIYAPASTVRFTGNSGLVTDCIQIIARHVIFTGNTSIVNECPPSSGAHAYGGANAFKLVG